MKGIEGEVRIVRVEKVRVDVGVEVKDRVRDVERGGGIRGEG